MSLMVRTLPARDILLKHCSRAKAFAHQLVAFERKDNECRIKEPYAMLYTRRLLTMLSDYMIFGDLTCA
ncbi:uncharacterized protein PHALS_09197 [Plasmopara halstedii]|uniref:Uncharacterized protein n=1 Tax=Plasmopara halstedii TaxID=4781 RepID=A0A0P1AE84_PLAHL|nr:uncharacterized protein PHALS_09197 [Plasmopara halstedii]CEG39141.1 hypothetical protein PHALS_09197 [Plasmopara halstedii]|eukprot:XP_024575510.1 hypothetical protein PHALS_09197 [Plasmopara halstedii]